MPGKLTLTHGLPGSGKSTLAEERVRADPGRVTRANRDDIRTKLFGAKYHESRPDKKSEAEVNTVQMDIIRKGLAADKNVIVDDLNLNKKTVAHLAQVAKNYKAELEQVYFNVPVAVCKERNKKRGQAGGRRVPDEVIDQIASKAYSEDGNIKDYVVSDNGLVFVVDRVTPGSKLIDKFNKQLAYNNPMTDNTLVLVDIDGTLANNSHDSAYAFRRAGEAKDFPYFLKSIAKAPVNAGVRDLANKMRDEEGLNLIVLTGRSDDYAEELISFIKKSGAKISKVIAKRENDGRPDNEFKKEQIGKLRDEGFVIVHGIDDRPRSVRTLESEGILVSRVDFTEDPYDSNNSGPIKEPNVNTIYGSGYCIRCGQPLKNGGNIGPVCRTKAQI